MTTKELFSRHCKCCDYCYKCAITEKVQRVAEELELSKTTTACFAEELRLRCMEMERRSQILFLHTSLSYYIDRLRQEGTRNNLLMNEIIDGLVLRQYLYELAKHTDVMYYINRLPDWAKKQCEYVALVYGRGKRPDQRND